MDQKPETYTKSRGETDIETNKPCNIGIIILISYYSLPW